MRIRHYGLLANSQRRHKLAPSRTLLGVVDLAPPTVDNESTDDEPRGERDYHRLSHDRGPGPCPVCGKPMRVIENISPVKRDTS
ncbi:hypothetical protein L6Q96_08930 [Candidatus Binatia bacterium]|nr:hypothetical protein [Candidatus Binatia bacterium]